MSEIELNLRLDSNCRTTTSFDPNNITNDDNSDNKNTVFSSIETIDYSSKTIVTSLSTTTNIPSPSASSSIKSTLLDDLLLDCEITDCALLPRTFWIPCSNFKPRCLLEQCALEIFYHHVRETAEDGKVNENEKNYTISNTRMHYDPNTSGAEWWVQIRPSPDVGRYKMLVQDEIKATNDTITTATSISATLNSHNSENDDNSNGKEDDEANKGICFHWDKDEDLRLLMDGKMYIHPHLSTVTYLTDIGPPTIALNYRVNALTGEYITPSQTHDRENHGDSYDSTNNSKNNNCGVGDEDIVEAYISWPKKGKHLSFDGRYLHAAPADLMEKGLFEKQIEIPLHNDIDNCHDLQKLQRRRHRRVTFLVNIWLNYKPFNVNVFPETMIDKLTKVNPNHASHILFNNDDPSKEKVCKLCPVKHHVYDKTLLSESDTKFEWSMGSSNSGCGDQEDKISMTLPVDLVQNEMGGNGNIKISWHDGVGIKLSPSNVMTNNDPLAHENKKQRVEKTTL